MKLGKKVLLSSITAGAILAGIAYAKVNFLFDSEKTLLARMIYGEARGCSDGEKAMVANTAINRLNMDVYGHEDTLRKVLLKQGQYSCLHGFGENSRAVIFASEQDRSFKRCLEIAGDVIQGKYQNPGQTKYHTIKTHPSWSNSADLIRLRSSPGDRHSFYVEKPKAGK